MFYDRLSSWLGETGYLLEQQSGQIRQPVVQTPMTSQSDLICRGDFINGLFR